MREDLQARALHVAAHVDEDIDAVAAMRSAQARASSADTSTKRSKAARTRRSMGDPSAAP
jgi:hypothetical protein